MKQRGKKMIFNTSTEHLERLKNVQGYDWKRAAEQKAGVTISAVLSGTENKKQNTGLKLLTVQDTNAVVFSNNEQGSMSCFLHQNIAALGKSSTKPNLFVFDSTRELYEVHAHTLEAEGYHVYLLDFSNAFHSDRWNPLSELIWRVKQIRELDNELENRDGKYYAIGEVYYTYKAARTRLMSHWNELYLSVSGISAMIIGDSADNEAELAEKIVTSFICAMCEDCVSSKLRTSQLLLTNVYQNIMKYGSGDYELFKEYLVDKRAKPSFSRVIMSQVFAEENKQELVKRLNQAVALISHRFDKDVERITSEATLDLYTEADFPKAVFIVNDKDNVCKNNHLELFFLQACEARAEVARELQFRINQKEPIMRRLSYFIINNHNGRLNIPFKGNCFKHLSEHNKLILVLQSYSQLIEKYGTVYGDWIKTPAVLKMFLSADDVECKKEYFELCFNRDGNENETDMTKAEVEIFDKAKGVGNAVVSIEENQPCPTHFTNAYTLLGLYCSNSCIEHVECTEQAVTELDEGLLFDIQDLDKEPTLNFEGAEKEVVPMR